MTRIPKHHTHDLGCEDWLLPTYLLPTFSTHMHIHVHTHSSANCLCLKKIGSLSKTTFLHIYQLCNICTFSSYFSIVIFTFSLFLSSQDQLTAHGNPLIINFVCTKMEVCALKVSMECFTLPPGDRHHTS